MTGTFRIGFVCVQNAGRSQMATAFAERQRAARGLDDVVELVSGGTDPGDEVHDVVVEVMADAGIDVSERTPRAVTRAELESCDLVVTMGCSTLTLGTDTDIRDWALPDPHGVDADRAREIRDRVQGKVASLFDEIEQSGR